MPRPPEGGHYEPPGPAHPHSSRFPSMTVAAETPLPVSDLPLPPAAAQTPRRRPWVLGMLFRSYRWRILLTYGLFNVENLLRVAQPVVLGLAINGLLEGSYWGLVLLAVQHVSQML